MTKDGVKLPKPAAGLGAGETWAAVCGEVGGVAEGDLLVVVADEDWARSPFPHPHMLDCLARVTNTLMTPCLPRLPRDLLARPLSAAAR